MQPPVYILGLSAFHHDSAACLLRDGEIVAAAQEERFSRRKHDPAFPVQAAQACLDAGGIPAERVDAVAFYDKPLLKLDRLLETHLSRAPGGIRAFLRAMPEWLKGDLGLGRTIRKSLGYSGPVLFAEHHLSHAASAFYPSPFDEAAILTVDGVGEWSATTIGAGRGSHLELMVEQRFPHSLGLLYSAFTSYTGFEANSGEGEVMELAPYGEPRYVDLILEKLVDLKPDGSFRLDMKYFDYAGGLRMTPRRFHRLLGGPPRRPEANLTQREMDLARSIQAVTEEILLRLARTAHERAGGPANLCLAGGVALNCVANGRILREGPFRDVWIQPAAGDAGAAIGAALALWHGHHGRPRELPAGGGDAMKGSFLGPPCADRDIARFIEREGAGGRRMEESDLLATVASQISEGRVVGWFQGPMEFGPRALGARSILGDPRDPRVQSRMNLKVKLREPFRPFAPSVLASRSADYFELDRPSPYMLLAAPVRPPVRPDRRIGETDSPSRRFGVDPMDRPRSAIPAVTQVDQTAPVQTVDERSGGRFFRLLEEFDRQTGCGVLINGSFNVPGEPIVCTPADAYRCFLRTGIDTLVMGSYLLAKDRQRDLEERAGRQRQLVLDGIAS